MWVFQVQYCIDIYKYCNIEILKISEDIANFSLFKINLVQVLELRELKKNIEIIKYAYIIFILKPCMCKYTYIYILYTQKWKIYLYIDTHFFI